MKTKKKNFPVQAIELAAAGVSADTQGLPHPEEFDDLTEAFGIHTWVYACANLIANSFAMIEFLPYVQDKDGSWVVNEKHPFRKVLQHPNPNMSGVEFRRLLSLSSKLTGNAFIICEPKAPSQPQEMWPLMPEKVKVKMDATSFVSGYVYTVNGRTQTLPPERIIHIRESTPNSLQYGQGAMSAVKNAITSDLLADAWNRNFFFNSGRPDAVLESVEPISPDAQKRVLKAWQKMNQGSKNRGKTAVLSGVKYVEINRLHKDMEFVNLRKMLREEVLAAFGVPQSMVQVLDQANYSNMEQQTKIFWTQTMIPEIRKFESIMTLRARQITGDTNTIIQADLSKVEALRTDEQARANVAKTYIDMGVPLAQVIEALDLPFELPDTTAPANDDPPANDTSKKQKAVKLGSVRDVEWKKFDRDVRPFEQTLESRLRAYFNAQRKRVLAKFDAHAEEIVPSNGKAIKSDHDSVRAIFNFDVEKELLGRVSAKHIRAPYVAFAAKTAQKMGRGIDFNVDESALGAWITRKVMKLQQEATVFTREQLSDAIVESVRDAAASGLSQSETIDQIRERITEVYDFAATGRAERIARTEVIGASNAGALQAMKDLGAVGKEWLTSRDDRVRETHDAMDGQVVGVGESFLSPDGETLQYPGDQSAGPGAVINCRCTVVPKAEA
jgi:HK97 family phage portal protein